MEIPVEDLGLCEMTTMELWKIEKKCIDLFVFVHGLFVCIVCEGLWRQIKNSARTVLVILYI